MDDSPREKKPNMTSSTHKSFSEENKSQTSYKTEKNFSFGEFIQQDPVTFNFQLVFEGANNLFLDVLFQKDFNL